MIISSKSLEEIFISPNNSFNSSLAKSAKASTVFIPSLPNSTNIGTVSPSKFINSSFTPSFFNSFCRALSLSRKATIALSRSSSATFGSNPSISCKSSMGT